MASHYSSIVAIALLLVILLAIPTNVQSIGVCFGRNGNGIPQPTDIVHLYKSNNIGAIRLYSPDHDVLDALRGSDIQLILGVPDPDLQSIASDLNSASTWVQTYVKAYASAVSFLYIAVGNEVELIPGDNTTYVLPAMRNIRSALSAAGLDHIKVSTVVSLEVVGTYELPYLYPPSAGVFSSAAQSRMQQIVQFLIADDAPLLVNVYPYYSYIYNEANIRLDHVMFTATGTFINDGPYSYYNLFDAIVDSVYSALEKVGGAGVRIVVSESGWPSAGGEAGTTTISNAQTYNQNLINHVGKGTPKRPGAIETYIFEMFNEDQKTGLETEKHFGLFYPNQQSVYPITFS